MDAYSNMPAGANIDLDRLLEASRKGQWSLADVDWGGALPKAESGEDEQCRYEAALLLLYLSGLERQAARIFDLCSRHVTDSRAQEIYKLFVRDEERHADAEIRLAERLGYSWDTAPLALSKAFEAYETVWESEAPLMFDFASAEIILFELGLDSVTIPLIKSVFSDPLHDEVLRRIDIDESRHLAMDYWLLEQRGREAKEEQRKRQEAGPTKDRRRARAERAAHMAFLNRYHKALDHARKTICELLPGHSLALIGAPSNTLLWNRIGDIPTRAPHARFLPEYRIALVNHKALAAQVAGVPETKE